MKVVIDQTDCRIKVEKKDLRIVSLVPSQTELLYYLELDEAVVGITKFCIHPSNWYQTKTRVGGTKSANLKLIEELEPSLIIANKEENTQSEIETLRENHPVYVSDIYAIEDAYQMIADKGVLTGTERKAERLIELIKQDFSELPSIRGTVLYFIWHKPYMTAGSHTFINTMLQLIGLENASTENLRYNEITEEEIRKINPDYIFLSSEPYPFKNEHVKTLENLTDSSVHLVGGEMFSWYGSRLLRFKSYFTENLYPLLENKKKQV